MRRSVYEWFAAGATRVDHHDSRIADTVAAIDALKRNPPIGRPAGAFDRELVIGRKSLGYLALYRHVEAVDTGFVLAVRSQSEAGSFER